MATTNVGAIVDEAYAKVGHVSIVELKYVVCLVASYRKSSK